VVGGFAESAVGGICYGESFVALITEVGDDFADIGGGTALANSDGETFGKLDIAFVLSDDGGGGKGDGDAEVDFDEVPGVEGGVVAGASRSEENEVE